MSQRENPLDDPDFLEEVATAFNDGASVTQIMHAFGVSRYMADKWKKTPAVQRRWAQLRDDRIRETIGLIEKRLLEVLQDMDNISPKELLMYRKEFVGGERRAQGERADEATIGQMQDAMEKNPELFAALEEELKKEVTPSNE